MPSTNSVQIIKSDTMFKWFSDVVWDDEIWFPKDALKVNFTWKDLENRPDLKGYYADVKDLNWAFLFGFLLLGVRYAFERVVVVPIVHYFEVVEPTNFLVIEHNVLERNYMRNGKLDSEHLKILSKQSDLSSKQIEIWFEKRKCEEAKQHNIKICCWRLLFYVMIFVYGAVVLWQKPWLWDSAYIWEGFPQFVDRDIYWYYMIELSFYWSLVFTINSDHKRKDIPGIIIHHVATISLLYFSWMCNFVRAGSLVLLYHTATDPWLCLAKLLKYCKKTKMANTCFLMFFIVWNLSRLTCFPYFVIYSCSIVPYRSYIRRTFFTHAFFNFLLYTLLVLNITWTFNIFKFVRKIIRKDQSDGGDGEKSDQD